jgi:squalene-hopene/tetraprenyl-beta-curcumene cyclase
MILDESIRARLDRAYAIARDALCAERMPQGYWLGELASSALATATAVSALSVVRTTDSHDTNLGALIDGGIRWLVAHQNADGGWGDTTRSRSNISTTMLVQAALHLAEVAQRHGKAVQQASLYIEKQGGTASMIARYGRDRTFAVPILANCALAGQANWQSVAPLPFELACLPHGLYRFLRLHVVSYALPALIAIGQLIHSRRPRRNVFVRWIRNLAAGPTLKRLQAIQPDSGGFLEAIPLTSFVTMSLAALEMAQHPVARKGVDFLRHTVRPDGSWPIDSNLSVWLTTLSVNALSADSSRVAVPAAEAESIRDWLLAQQLHTVHRYTNAAPGGWGWSHLSGSVPDADDTAGALLALANLPLNAQSAAAADRAIQWLLDLQNSDGGWPTFCRGWGQLPFDRSGTDLTAHVLRALCAWRRPWIEPCESATPKQFESPGYGCAKRLRRAAARAVGYLREQQRTDGTWVPLWFGNECVAGDENPLYGTCKVLTAYVAMGRTQEAQASRAIDWLRRSQNADGGWGGSAGVASSVEETGLAVEALAAAVCENSRPAIGRGIQWLLDRVESGDWRNPSPIGLYFAKLWYFEKLYPAVYTVAALGRARRLWSLPLTPASA